MRLLILVLKSPHTIVSSCGYSCSSMASTFSVACVSYMFLLISDGAGGKYTFTIFILWLFGNVILVCKAYSFPVTYSTYSYFFMYVAIPPLVPFFRRCSYKLYPSRAGIIVCSVNHVSYKHMMSRSY
jgi:hypothetical protein